MNQTVNNLKSRIENNIVEIETYYDSIHMFLSQTKIIDEVNLGNIKVQKWLYDNRYTIIILEEILDKIESKKRLSA
ncbi:MAG: hypothetical protein HRT43_11315 [Campylobacteraceae bacterium]|nr:hypothetical protein [Campylobacteraceae bacterium]